MNEIVVRLWHNITARLTGPMNLRLIIQPTVATILAVRAGLRDAHQNRPAFLWVVLRNSAHRRDLLRQGRKYVGKVFFVAVILDVIYQLIVHRGVYLLELLITAVTLAIVPYVLLRGPISRIARMVMNARSVKPQKPQLQGKPVAVGFAKIGPNERTLTLNSSGDVVDRPSGIQLVVNPWFLWPRGHKRLSLQAGQDLGEFRTDEDSATRNHAADRQELADNNSFFKSYSRWRRFYLPIEPVG